MRAYFLSFILAMFCTLVSCSDDSGINNSSEYKIQMDISGDQTLEFRTNTANIIVPPANPIYRISGSMTNNGMTHTFSILIDDVWLDKDTIDLTRNLNMITFAYDAGKDGNTYRAVAGTFIVEDLSSNRAKGTFSATLAKLGHLETTITITNGKIDISK
ncbi:MAG: hypothetical protein WC313_06595 [Candidatus Kapaibacterium sp.]